MKTNGKRVISLLLAICMVAGMVHLPGVMASASAEEITNVIIPSVLKEYVNATFENTTDQEKIAFVAGHPDNNNIADVVGDNGYIYLEKNAAENPQAAYQIAEDKVDPYLVVEAKLASTKISGAALKLTGTSETLSFVDVAADGKISSFGTATNKAMAADGTFVTVTVSVDAAANKYSLWIDGVQAINAAAIPVEAFGSVTAMSIDLTGENTEAANLMVDDVKVYTYDPILDYNDFSTDMGNFTLLRQGHWTNASEIKAVGTEGNNAFYIRGISTNGDVAYWNKNGAVALPNQFVVSFDHAGLTAWSNWRLNLVDTDGNVISLLWNNSNGGLKRLYLKDDGTGGSSEYSIAATTGEATNWSPITLIFDLDAKTYTYIGRASNGNAVVAENLKLRIPTAGFGTPSYLAFTSRGDNEGGSYVNGNVTIDNFAVYAGTEVRETIDMSAIPAAAESLVDASFDYNQLAGITLAANAEANKAKAPEANHYIYMQQNGTSNKSHTYDGAPKLTYDLSNIDSQYVAISMDIATTMGGAPINVTVSDGTNAPSINLIRINADGELMIDNAGLNTPKKIALDGTYHNFTFVIDTENDVFTTWYDGVALSGKGIGSSTVGSLNGTADFGLISQLFVKTGWTKPANVMIDNVKVYSYDPAAQVLPTEPPTEAPTEAPAPTEPPFDGTYINQNFDTDAKGVSLLDGASKYEGNIAAWASDESGNGYVHLKRPAGSPYKARLNWNYGNTVVLSDNAVYSFDMALVTMEEVRFKFHDGVNELDRLLFVDSERSVLKAIVSNGEGGTKFVDLFTYKEIGDFTHYDIAFNVEANTYSVYIDHVLKGADLPYPGTLTAMGEFIITTWSDDAELYVDNLYIYDGERPRCLTPDKYLNIDFENGIPAGVSLNKGDGETDINEIRGDENNHYLFMQHNNGTDGGSIYPKLYYRLDDVIDTDYVKFSVDIASTSLATAYIKLGNTGAGGSWNLLGVYGYGDKNHEAGVLKIDGVTYDNLKLAEDGEFVTVTAILNTARDTFSLWLDDTQVIFNKEIGIEFGRVGSLMLEHSGLNGNFMFDNIEIVEFFPEEEYKVTWNVGGVITEEYYFNGSTPAFKGELTKEGNDEFGYKFIGWDKEFAPVTGEVTYTALFEEYTKSYTITWDVEGVLTTQTYPYGATPSFDGTPTKAEDENFTYEFIDWTPTVDIVTGDATYVAEFEAVEKEIPVYTITWIVGDSVTTQQYQAGQTPDFGSIPVMDSDEMFDYEFIDWSPVVDVVTGDATYVAEFEAIEREYTITWNVNGVETTTTYVYGETPDFGSIPTKAEDENYTYEFSSWSPAIAPVTGDATYTAQFTATAKIVKFDFDGATMTLGSNLDMSFYIEPSDLQEGESYYVVITREYADDRADAQIRVDQADWSWHTGYKQYYVAFKGIAAKEMTDSIRLVVYNSKDQAVSNEWVDSVRDYVMRMLTKEEKKTNPSVVDMTMFVEMLNYGAAAQYYFSNYNIEDLANGQLTEKQKGYALSEVPMVNNVVKGNGYNGTSLTLESQILTKIFFRSDVVNQTMKAVVSFTDHYGNFVTKEIAGSEFAKNPNDSDWYIPITEVAIADYGQLVTVTIYDAEGNEVTSAADSIESYAARNSRGNDLYRAITAFGIAAKAYFHK